MASQRDIALLRMAAQRLVGTPCADVIAAARLLGCVQAQDLPGALMSLALRVDGGTRAAVEHALDVGQVVRSWPMRGTLHFVPSEDLGWMLELTGARQDRQAVRRWEELGLDEATRRHAADVAIEALAGAGLGRAELLAAWQSAGIATDGQRAPHLIGHLARTGVLCLGPMRGREQANVLLEEWVPQPRKLDRDEALAEWVVRFFLGHGPATVKDFVRWTGLTVTDANIGLAVARAKLESIEVDGIEYLMDPETPARLDACRDEVSEVFLLPGFDELVLGYADRSVTVPPEFAERIVPGGNGMFRPTVVANGRAVGTWRRAGSGKRLLIEAEPFTEFTPEVEAAIQTRADEFLTREASTAA